MNRAAVSVLGLFLFFLLSGGKTYGQNPTACDCETPGQFDILVDQADLIFQGTLISKKPNWMSGGMKYTFEVTQSWKTSCDKIRFVNSGWEQDCGYIFKEGVSYLVFAEKKHTSMKTNRCMGTKTLEQATQELEWLGPGMAPQKPKQVARTNISLFVLTLLGIVFVAFVVLKKRKT